MTRHAWLDPSPFFLAGGDTGCLLVHGFTGSPPEMRPVGDYLAERGITVYAPLLPGHGTQPEDLNRVRWQDWTAEAESALQMLQQRCRRLFVAGLSMGALVTLYLGWKCPNLSGLVAFSPGLVANNKLIYLTPFLKYLFRFWPKSGNDDADLTDPEAHRRLWSYEINPTWGAHELLKLQRAVRRLLPTIRVPTLIIQSTADATISMRSGQIIYDEIGSPDKELVLLHNSGHCITVDSEREAVCAKTYEFIVSHS